MSKVERRSLKARVLERFRYGLAVQEVIDVLQRRFNIVLYPYYIVAENLNEHFMPSYDSSPPFSVRYLEEKDMGELIEIRPWMSPSYIAKLKSEINQFDCLGISVEGRLAGTTWSRNDIIPLPICRQSLVELDSREAYLFDAYVGREFRGYRLAPIVRYELYRELVKKGKTQFYSVSLAFNNSSRRFKAKLGAKEIELRILIGIMGWRAIDFRLRSKESIKFTPKFEWLKLK